MMAAHTRMPGSASTAQKEAFVTDLINRLGLTKSADSVVGGAKKRGLSGGEKKRLSIGAELIAEPMLLFTDEPTTGLDSFQAEKVSQLVAIGIVNVKHGTPISKAAAWFVGIDIGIVNVKHGTPVINTATCEMLSAGSQQKHSCSLVSVSHLNTFPTQAGCILMNLILTQPRTGSSAHALGCVIQTQVLLMLRSDCFAAALMSGKFCWERASL